MNTEELQKWIDWFTSIGISRVNLEKNDKEDIIAKFRRFVGPRNFDDKYREEKDWFYIEVILYEDKISYEFLRDDEDDVFDRRDELRILSQITSPSFTKATGEFDVMGNVISEMSEKLNFLINHPTPYIKNKLEEIPV